MVALKLPDAAITVQDTLTISSKKQGHQKEREYREIVGKYGKMHLKMWMERVVGYYNNVK